ncbi:hypothetical protein [Pseudemcibacter aquimaris]|uniref:hypothetical protein n=1 Tax=Pseudemcibacter aquimaris TaxID=2857064 RepID=UPI00201108BF|nr:hypothetical protein [Pseudemcibacter aquimaris]MCC3859897.1 hypothetical protein [Pseudemcibacter aquimaris]WDU57229.1 hypothetical protein KW060_08465 [Pseudemcibacter aquimaris]
MLKKFVLLFGMCVISFQYSAAQDLDPENYTTANIYYHVGAVSGLGETIKYDLKKIGLSAPMDKETIDTYEPIFKHAIERQGIKYYREDDFLVTDMFPEERTNGKILLIMYKDDQVLKDYMAVKAYKQKIIDDGKYDLAARREIATRFGKLLSYHDDQIEFFLKRSGLH